MGATTTTQTRKHAPPEVRRAQILDAAQQCFGQSGYHRTTMDQIVAASGLSKGSLYRHFSNKDDVLLALFDRYAAELFEAGETRAAAAGSAADGLRCTAELFSELLVGKRELMQSWLGFLEHPQARNRMAAVYSESRVAVAALFEQGMADGEFRKVSASHFAAAMTGLAEGVLLQALMDEAFDPFPPLRDATDALLRGIAR